MSYTGLAQCAENHVRTLLTGKIQPETPYFEQAVRSGSFNAPRLPGLALRGSTITGLRPQTGPADILVVNAQGKVVRTVSTVMARAFDCRTLNLAAGNYTAVVRTPRGERMLPGLTVLR
jgi:hypothetical protein